MLALQERFGGRVLPVSARVMSDGMLRFLAFAAALLEPPLLDEVGDRGISILVRRMARSAPEGMSSVPFAMTVTRPELPSAARSGSTRSDRRLG